MDRVGTGMTREKRGEGKGRGGKETDGRGKREEMGGKGGNGKERACLHILSQGTRS